MNTFTDEQFEALPITVIYGGEHKKDDWSYDLWHVTIKDFTTQYKTGLGLRKKAKKTYSYEKDTFKPVKPSNKDIMHSLLLDASAIDESFLNWCDNYGYDCDSIKALNIYNACCETGKALQKIFTCQQIEAMREALQDY